MRCCRRDGRETCWSRSTAATSAQWSPGAHRTARSACTARCSRAWRTCTRTPSSARWPDSPTCGRRRTMTSGRGASSCTSSWIALRPSRRSVSADVRLGVAPHSLRAVDPQSLKELIAALDEHSPIHMHAAEQTREVEECTLVLGKRPVEWLLENCPVDGRWCLVHATHMVASEITGLAASRAVAGLCPSTEANLGDGIFPLLNYRGASGRH